ncbi:MAG: patatin-like phospholipase family protein [Proteobacteria bacterium]|nr:patatin-like phospholipase family protein [Pseudomonadota bacterium]
MKTGTHKNQAKTNVIEVEDEVLVKKIENLNILEKKSNDDFVNVQQLLDTEKTIKLFRKTFENTKEDCVPLPPIKYLAFQGGGAKGTAYIGAIETLDEQGYLESIDKVCGASAGAITAFVVGLGFDSKQFKHIQENMNFLDFTDLKNHGWGEFFNGNTLGKGLDVVRYGAAFDGNAFHHWASFMVEQILGDKNATFRELHEKKKSDPTLKDLIFKATRYNAANHAQAEQTFSFEETPEVCIADALRASMAFPVAFKPWKVKQKEFNKNANDKSYSLETFGVFADGGILNNYPIDVFNSQSYYDGQYLPVERKDHNGKPIEINPCALGFSLTPLKHLDNNITPMTQRLIQLQNKERSSEEQTLKDTNSSWGYQDLWNVLWWTKVGQNQVSKPRDKHETYHDQTVQIWPENVETLEFDASKEKLNSIKTNGRLAMQLWIDKFRDSKQAYQHLMYFDDRLSKQELRLRVVDPVKFYLTKLEEHFLSFIGELQRENKISLNGIDKLSNIKLQYLTYKINDLIKEGKLDELTVNNTLMSAFNKFVQRQQKINLERKKRDNLTYNVGLIEELHSKIQNFPDEVCRMLSGQLSNIFPLMQQVHQSRNLLGVLAQSKDVNLIANVFELMLERLKQCHFQGRVGNVKEEFIKILNHAKPSICVAAVDNDELLQIFNKHGLNPLQVNKLSGLNALQETIKNGDFSAYKKLIQFCHLNKIPFKEKNHKILSFMLSHASAHFIRQVFEDKQLLKRITNDHFVQSCGNDVFEFCSKLSFLADETLDDDIAVQDDMMTKLKTILQEPAPCAQVEIVNVGKNLHFMQPKAKQQLYNSKQNEKVQTIDSSIKEYKVCRM